MNPKRKTIKHYDIEGHAHYLTFSCYRQHPLLSQVRTCHWLIESIEAARKKHRFDLWAWVMMPNHAHLLIRPRLPDYRMGNILRSIKQPVGKRAFTVEQMQVIARVFHLPASVFLPKAASMSKAKLLMGTKS